MNILILTTHFNEGGISRYCFALSAQLKKMGHKVFVASSGGDLVEELRENGVIHFPLNIRTKSELSWKIWSSLFTLKRLLKDNDIQIIHAQTRVTQVLACLAQRFYKVPYISTCHGFFQPRFFRRKFPCWGRRVIAISLPVKEHLIRDLRVPVEKIVYIRHGLDFVRFEHFSPEIINECREGLGLGEGPVIGVIARLSSVKGHEFLLRAMTEVLKEFPAAQLLIIGEGNMKNKLLGIARNLGFCKNIIFVPRVKDTAAALGLMDVFVMPSLQEGLGLSIMEAMAAAKAIVASRVGGIPDLIKDGQNGLLVSPRDTSALGRAIIRLLKDKELRMHLGTAASAFIRKEYPLEQMAIETGKVYGMDAKRILVVNVNWLGDCLFSTPIFKALKAAFPQSYLACMAVPRVKEVLEGNPYIDELIIYDEDDAHKPLFGKIGLIRQLRQKKFDTVFLLHRSFTRALLVYLAGIPIRVGYHTAKRGFLLTKAVYPEAEDVHRMDYYLKVVESAGIEVADRNYQFFIKDNDRQFIDRLLKENGIVRNDPFAVLNPGGNWDLKRWPRENFRQLADHLIAELGFKAVISGAAKDAYLAKEIAGLMRQKPVILCGETSLKQLGALFERARVVVSADSGPAHIACAVGAPSVVLFGPTAREVTGPRGRSKCVIIQKRIEGCAVPCYKLDCPDNRCMKIIGVDEVFEEIKRINFEKTLK